MSDTTAVQETDPEVQDIIKLEQELQTLVAAPGAFEILRQKDELDAKIEAGLTKLKGLMELSHTKKIAGEWGWITLVETTRFTIAESQLPEEYFKRVPDTKKIGDRYKLTNTPVPGTTPVISTSLRKKIK
jgi:hypothetical protein